MYPISTCIATRACVYTNTESRMTPDEKKANVQPYQTKVYPPPGPPPSGLDVLCLLDEAGRSVRKQSGTGPSNTSVCEHLFDTSICTLISFHGVEDH